MKKRPVKRYSALDNNEYYYSDYRLAQQSQKLFELSGLGKEELKKNGKNELFFLRYQKSERIV